MGQLIMFLVYLLIFAGLVWQVILLVREPASRSLPRVALTAVLAILTAGIIYYGVLN